MIKDPKDIVNKEFGKYKVISLLEGKHSNNFHYQCKCVCGKINNISRYDLQSGKRTICKKCSYEQRRENLINQKFGKWIVKEYIGKYHSQNSCWLCECICGNTQIIPAGRLKFKSSRQCRSCQSRKYIGKISGNYFSKIKISAKQRKLEFNITKEYIWDLFLKQNNRCIISGMIIDFAGSYMEYREGKTTASLDRIDSSLGYIEGNVQWVHKDINWMKQDFDQEYFISICKIIAENNK